MELKTAYTIRPMTANDVAGVVALQRQCFPEPFPADQLWQSVHIERHLEIFAEGQFVAVVGDMVVGSCTNMRTSRAIWDSHLPWESVVGDLFLSGHAPEGEVLYGIDVSVAPAFRRQGIAREFYQARFNFVRSASMDQYGTVCRLPGLQASGLVSARAYAESVVARERIDPTLTPLLHLGLRFVGVIEGYMSDPESGDAGAILEWRP